MWICFDIKHGLISLLSEVVCVFHFHMKHFFSSNSLRPYSHKFQLSEISDHITMITGTFDPKTTFHMRVMFSGIWFSVSKIFCGTPNNHKTHENKCFSCFILYVFIKLFHALIVFAWWGVIKHFYSINLRWKRFFILHLNTTFGFCC